MTHDSDLNDWYDELAGALRSRWLSDRRITEIVSGRRAAPSAGRR